VSAQAASGGSKDAFWTGELDYRLPEDRIAQQPASERDASRLMVLDRSKDDLVHASFRDIASFLPPGALLVVNDSRVIPARLRGRKQASGGAVEALLLGTSDGSIATAMVRVAKPLRTGQTVEFASGVTARVLGEATGGRIELDFAPGTVADALAAAGELPLPPYIERGEGPTSGDLDRYQTVYADEPGSVAAPTAGLHFSRDLLASLEAQGFEIARVTLHVGPGTFTPVRGDVEAHRMEEERYFVPEATAERIAEAKRAGRSVVAVGTTTVRTLETASQDDGSVEAGEGTSRLFIRPGHRFRVVDALVTNFHLPGSTLLALVMALAGRERIRAAYETAVREGYRFYSYGDAMLIR
jgi:S-adenosylmethionine:tRNA ribosyltransferase-isomerase